MSRNAANDPQPLNPDPNPEFEDEVLSNTSNTDTPSTSTALSVTDIAEALVDDDLELGIDKLDLYANAHALVSGTEWEWDQFSVLNGASTGLRQTVTRHVSSGHKYRLFVENRGEHGYSVRTTFNPSQFGPLVGIDEAMKTAAVIWEDMEQLLHLAHPLEDSRIGRIDISVDFAPLEDQASVLEAAHRAIPKPQWLRVLTGRDGKTLGSTVEHGTKTMGSILVYDKSRQAGLTEPTIRVEARVEKKARNKYELVHLSDVTPEALLRAFRDLSEPFARAFSKAPNVGNIFDQHRPRIVAEAIGILALEEHGIIVPINKNRRTTLRRIQNDLGVADLADLQTLSEGSDEIANS